jgi:4-aminobutyrate aminotransferase/4-aminobutyrate aminotransferase/(S)-3-amino-2-methylpropionate transaminase
VLGRRLVEKLDALKGRVPAISEVRSLGAMVGVEFRDEAGAPLPQFVKRAQDIALAKGLLLLTCGVHGNVIRFLFPLTIEDEVFEEGLSLLTESLLEA